MPFYRKHYKLAGAKINIAFNILGVPAEKAKLGAEAVMQMDITHSGDNVQIKIYTEDMELANNTFTVGKELEFKKPDGEVMKVR